MILACDHSLTQRSDCGLSCYKDPFPISLGPDVRKWPPHRLACARTVDWHHRVVAHYHCDLGFLIDQGDVLFGQPSTNGTAALRQ